MRRPKDHQAARPRRGGSALPRPVEELPSDSRSAQLAGLRQATAPRNKPRDPCASPTPPCSAGRRRRTGGGLQSESREQPPWQGGRWFGRRGAERELAPRSPPALRQQRREPGPAPSAGRFTAEQQERAAVAGTEAETEEAAQAQPGGTHHGCPAICAGWTPPAQGGPRAGGCEGGEHVAEGASAGPRWGDEAEDCPGKGRRSRARSHRSSQTRRHREVPTWDKAALSGTAGTSGAGGSA